jgi:protein-S-isoprenylcysteine O-methyltransferase Ste14
MNAARPRQSPWWYRRRGAVLTAIYVAGFLTEFVPLGAQDRPVFMVWGERFANGHGGAILLWAAVASAVIAWLCRGSGTAFLRRDVVFAADVQNDRLIVAGPFRYVRNPLYLGNMFLALAASALASPVGAVIILAGNGVLVGFLAAEESRQMAERYGAVYTAFREAVPAFVPRLTPARIAGSVTAAPSWAAGLLGESFCLAFAIALVPVALFGPAGFRAFWAVWIPALVFFMGWGWWAGRRRTSLG